MGEAGKDALRVGFDRSIKLEFHGTKLSSDSGLFPYRDLDDAAEQWIKKGKYAVRWTRLSCHSFDANQVRLQLHVLAYNLGNFLCRLALPPCVKHWTLTTMRDKLIKIDGKLVRHARYVTSFCREQTEGRANMSSVKHLPSNKWSGDGDIAVGTPVEKRHKGGIG